MVAYMSNSIVYIVFHKHNVSTFRDHTLLISRGRNEEFSLRPFGHVRNLLLSPIIKSKLSPYKIEIYLTFHKLSSANLYFQFLLKWMNFPHSSLKE